MAITDPQSITISGVTTSLPRTEVQGTKSVYQSADGLLRFTASHNYGKRTRRVVRIDHSKIAPDVFVPAQNQKLSMSNYLVFDIPALGYTLSEQQAVYAGFKAMLAVSSDAIITDLLGGES